MAVWHSPWCEDEDEGRGASGKPPPATRSPLVVCDALSLAMAIVVAVVYTAFCHVAVSVSSKQAYANLPHMNAEPGWQDALLPIFGGPINTDWAEKNQPPLNPDQANRAGLPSYGNPNLPDRGGGGGPSRAPTASRKKEAAASSGGGGGGASGGNKEASRAKRQKEAAAAFKKESQRTDRAGMVPWVDVGVAELDVACGMTYLPPMDGADADLAMALMDVLRVNSEDPADVRGAWCLLRDPRNAPLVENEISAPNGRMHKFLRVILESKFIMEDLQHARKKMQFPVYWELIVAFVDAGAAVQLNCGFGLTPLHIAVRYRRLDLIDALLAAGADASAQDDWGDVPAVYAMVGTGEQINIFSRMVVDDNIAKSGMSASKEALNHMTSFDQFVESQPLALELWNARRVDGFVSQKAVRAAVNAWTNDILARPGLLPPGVTRGAEGSSRVFGWTLLHRAAHQGNTAACEMLVKLGVDALAKDHLGRVALHLAALRGFNETVAALVPPTAKAHAKAHGGSRSELVALSDVVDASGLSVSDALGSTAPSRRPQVAFGADAKKLAKEAARGPRDLSGVSYGRSGHVEPNSKEGRQGGGWNPWEASELVIDHCDIEQRDAAELDADAFVKEYVLRRKPVVIRGGAKSSANAAWKLNKRWTLDKMRTKYGATRFPVGGIPYYEMFGKQGITPTLAEFIDSHNAGWWKDNHRNLIDAHGAPYYIFTNAAPSLLPEAMGDFPNSTRFDTPGTRALGLAERNSYFLSRHSYQFYLGPPYSGSPPHYHSDAWNALAFGRKRWMLFPPDRAAYSSKSAYQFLQPSADGKLAPLPASMGEPLECVQEQGDVLFVPDFWGHVVINLRESVGIAGEWETNYWFH